MIPAESSASVLKRRPPGSVRKAITAAMPKFRAPTEQGKAQFG